MADVADLAGVSHQTVSRVLNEHPSVRPATRARVQEAIAALGYRRNSAARALATARSATIGVVTTGSPLFGPASTLIAVEEAARAQGFFVSVASIDAYDVASMHVVLEHFLGQGVEGIVVIAAHASVAAAVYEFGSRVPVVLIAAGCPKGGGAGPGGRPRDGGGPGGRPGALISVAVDQRAGARAATEYLLDLGHSTVWHVAGPLDWVDAVERREGWRQAQSARGIDDGVCLEATWSASDGYAIGNALIAGAHGPLPTALLAGNDQLALGLLRAFAEGHVAVPGRVSVVGFDDVEGADQFLPPLTTVRQPFGVLGRRCIDLLVAAIGGPDGGGGVRRGHGAGAEIGGAASGVPRATIAPELVVRRTAGPPLTA